MQWKFDTNSPRFSNSDWNKRQASKPFPLAVGRRLPEVTGLHGRQNVRKKGVKFAIVNTALNRVFGALQDQPRADRKRQHCYRAIAADR
jgi:hypothetical protein